MKEEELSGRLHGPERTLQGVRLIMQALRPSRTEAPPGAEMGDPPVSATNFRRLTGILLIVTPVMFSLFFAVLQATFNYPAILAAINIRSRVPQTAGRPDAMGHSKHGNSAVWIWHNQ